MRVRARDSFKIGSLKPNTNSAAAFSEQANTATPRSEPARAQARASVCAEARAATCALARVRPAADICCQCCQCFQSSPVACDCARPLRIELGSCRAEAGRICRTGGALRRRRMAAACAGTTIFYHETDLPPDLTTGVAPFETFADAILAQMLPRFVRSDITDGCRQSASTART